MRMFVTLNRTYAGVSMEGNRKTKDKRCPWGKVGRKEEAEMASESLRSLREARGRWRPD